MSDLCLVQMPFSMLYQPSLALSMLKMDAKKAGLSSVIDYANLRFAHLIGVLNYEKIQAPGVLYFTGEALFSEAAGFPNDDCYEQYFRLIEGFDRERKKMRDFDFRFVKEAFYEALPHVQPFIAGTAERLLDCSPKIIACSSNFQQNNACFALCKKIKEFDPSVVTVMGGAQCAADMGAAISRHIASVDYVFSGEADQTFGELCAGIISGASPETLPYGTMSKRFPILETAPYATTCDLNALPIPNYDEYFSALKQYGLHKRLQPTLLIEGSRGCWWGEKKPCTFCGLGSVTRKYRVKDTARLVDEMNAQSEKYGTKHFLMTDSILSKEHMKALLPELQRRNKGYSLFCEIKSNLSESDVKNLRDAGFTFIQPGIESLQDDMLALMRKGNTAIKHIELLRNCRTYGMKISWNILVGFPGEQMAWLKEMLQILPLLSHLQSPNNLNHIFYQRYSEYTNRPEAYGLVLEPMAVYSYVYPGSGEFIRGIGYNAEPMDPAEKIAYYDLPQKGPIYHDLLRAFYLWAERFLRHADRLQMFNYSDRIEILDLRRIALNSCYTLRGLQQKLYEDCRIPQKRESLYEKYADDYEEKEIAGAIDFLREHFLIVAIKNEILALATENLGYCFEKDQSPFGAVKEKKGIE
jgi:magnesium-protoporphyrin IX monomethyl ester (oxidative) cyclase